jgi:hypothetical protein
MANAIEIVNEMLCRLLMDSLESSGFSTMIYFSVLSMLEALIE